MVNDSRHTWDKLILELDALQSEAPTALIPLLVGTNLLLDPMESMEPIVRTVQFMAYELSSKSEHLSEQERLQLLLEFFFSDKGFQVQASKIGELTESDYLLKAVLQQRRGHPLTLTILFLYLAQQIDVPMFMIQVRNHYILKWVRGGKCHYLDFLNEGRVLREDDLVNILNRAVPIHGGLPNSLDNLSMRLIYQRYLEDLGFVYEREQKLHQLHAVLNILLHMDTAHLQTLGRRALLRQRLGYAKEALADLKRYFSFVDRNTAPPEIQHAWTVLDALNDPTRPAPNDLIH